MYNKVVLITSCLEEALKEKEKPKEEEKEKPKDAAGLECKPRPLHKTCSLFMRNIAPNISRAEIISVSGDIGLGQGWCESQALQLAGCLWHWEAWSLWSPVL